MMSEIKGRIGKKEICPFCFEYFELRKTPFRCNSPMKRCAPTVDPVLQNHWEDNRPVGKVLASEGRFVRIMQCKDCGLDSKKRLCPNCHSDLPHTMGDFKNHIFAVIGAKEAGKSHYLAVLIEQIKKQIGPNLDMLLESMNDETLNRYRNVFYDPVFRDGRVIDATLGGLAEAQRPLVYSLTISRKNIFGQNSKDAIIIVFFDTAGEDLNDEDVMSSVNKYIYRSNGIILLVDPLQLVKVRDKLRGTTALPGVNTESSEIMSRVTRLIQKGQGLKVTDNINIPLAVTFPKFDALQPFVDEQFQVSKMSNHNGGFDSNDFNAVNNEMMELLNEWGGQELIQQVKTHYPKYGFFGVSALGCNPQKTKKIARVLSRRVEDPFLWLLSVNGFIKPLGEISQQSMSVAQKIGALAHPATDSIRALVKSCTDRIGALAKSAIQRVSSLGSLATFAREFRKKK